MRFLGVGDNCDLAALYLRLQEEGHEVKICIHHPLCQETLAGLVDHVPDWRSALPWVRAAGDNGIVLFENVGGGRGEIQDQLRCDGFNVIGSSTYGSRLENERGYAQRVLAEMGLPTAAFWEFADRDDGLAFLETRPGRYVFKCNGPDEPTYVGKLRDGRDLKTFLGTRNKKLSFILMEFIDGVEMGVGAYFNGVNFLEPACFGWEHKRFFPGDLGELTGEMGTVVTYSRTKKFFDRTLAKMEAPLRENGYFGYINLNTIVNADGIWPLEFTCRFGYPGSAILDPLQETSWGDLFYAMVSRRGDSFNTRAGFAAGIVMTTPPFPYGRNVVKEPVGMPVIFDGIDEDDRHHLHYGEVGMKGGHLVTSGAYGWTMVVTGVGQTVRQARDRANALADRVVVPNVRYRRDIGDRLIAGELDRLVELGVL